MIENEQQTADSTAVHEQIDYGYWQQLAAYVVLNLADIISTKLVLDNGGVEYNPFAQPFVESEASMIAYKAILGSVFVFLLNYLDKHLDSESYSKYGLMLANLILFGFVTKNLTFFL